MLRKSSDEATLRGGTTRWKRRAHDSARFASSGARAQTSVWWFRCGSRSGDPVHDSADAQGQGCAISSPTKRPRRCPTAPVTPRDRSNKSALKWTSIRRTPSNGTELSAIPVKHAIQGIHRLRHTHSRPQGSRSPKTTRLVLMWSSSRSRTSSLLKPTSRIRRTSISCRK